MLQVWVGILEDVLGGREQPPRAQTAVALMRDKMLPMATIKAEFILEGGILAMQAAQAALRDAVKAYDADSYATATVMGAVAAEHLVRCGWLLSYALSLKIEDAEVECLEFTEEFARYVDNSRHEERLQQSLYGFTELLSNLPPLQELIDSCMGNYTKKERQLINHWLIDKMKKRAGSSFHDLREQAQYLELLKNCTGWSTPMSVNANEVHAFLMDVGNSYGVMLMMTFNPTTAPAIQATAKKLGLDESLRITKGHWPSPEGELPAGGWPERS
jgi:AbiV family abortive infection protein